MSDASNNNGQTPTPEEMGAKLDEEIKETVEDWTNETDNTDFDDLDKRIDTKLRKTIAGWVGTQENASWKDIGGKMDANTREQLAEWVGTEKDADWSAISDKIDTRIRSNIAGLIHAQGEEGDVSWSEIGTKLESDVRGWVGGLVGTSEDADWQTIANQMVDKVRAGFDKFAAKAKKSDQSSESERSGPVKIEISSEEEGTNVPPSASSSEPVEPSDTNA